MGRESRACCPLVRFPELRRHSSWQSSQSIYCLHITGTDFDNSRFWQVLAGNIGPCAMRELAGAMISEPRQVVRGSVVGVSLPVCHETFVIIFVKMFGDPGPATATLAPATSADGANVTAVIGGGIRSTTAAALAPATNTQVAIFIAVKTTAASSTLASNVECGWDPAVLRLSKSRSSNQEANSGYSRDK